MTSRTYFLVWVLALWLWLVVAGPARQFPDGSLNPKGAIARIEMWLAIIATCLAYLAFFKA